MTIAEAAAFGVPTLLHHGTIGAKDLLPPCARFDTDMEDVAVAGEALASVVGTGEAAVAVIGQAAKEASLAWNLESFQAKLKAIVEEAAAV